MNKQFNWYAINRALRYFFIAQICVNVFCLSDFNLFHLSFSKYYYYCITELEIKEIKHYQPTHRVFLVYVYQVNFTLIVDNYMTVGSVLWWHTIRKFADRRRHVE